MPAKNLVFAIVALSVLGYGAALAHDGHHPARLVADVLTDGDGARLAITNHGAQPIVVMGLRLPGVGQWRLVRPAPVGPDGARAVIDLPEGFETGQEGGTVILDLGADGIFPVLLPKR